MPPWPGGPCPDCGDDMPPNLIRCATCRALLNPDLKPAEIWTPDFFELKEIETVADAEVIGFLLRCPGCEKELRVDRSFEGKTVACKFCETPFRCDLSEDNAQLLGVFSVCPHCTKILRAARKYLDAKVSCRFCNGAIRFVIPRAQS